MNIDYDHKTNMLANATEIVSAYVANNSVSADDLPTLIAEVHRALVRIGEPKEEPQPELVPAVSIKKSITPDYIICLDDGLKFKSLKRHLAGLGMTPAEYRTKWGLPGDYPMVASSYSARRSEVAKANGLGRKQETATEVIQVPAKKGRGRPKKIAKRESL